MSEEFNDIQHIEDLENPQHNIDETNIHETVEDITEETPIEELPSQEIIEDINEETPEEELPSEETFEDVKETDDDNKDIVEDVKDIDDDVQLDTETTNRLFTSYNSNGTGSIDEKILAACYNGIVFDESTGNIWYKGMPYGNAYVGGNYGNILGDRESLVTQNTYEFAVGTYNVSNVNTYFSIGVGDEEERKNVFEINDGRIYSTSLETLVPTGVEGFNGTNPTEYNDLSAIIKKISIANNTPVQYYEVDEENGAVLSNTDSEASSRGSIAFGDNCKAIGKYTQAFGKNNVVDSIGIDEEDLIGALCILVENESSHAQSLYVCSSINNETFTFTDYISGTGEFTLDINDLFIGKEFKIGALPYYKVIDISHNLINSSASFGVDNYTKGNCSFTVGYNNDNISNNLQDVKNIGFINLGDGRRISTTIYVYNFTSISNIRIFNGDQLKDNNGVWHTLYTDKIDGSTTTAYCSDNISANPYDICRKKGVCKNKYNSANYITDNNTVIGTNNIIFGENNCVLGSKNTNIKLLEYGVSLYYNEHEYNFAEIIYNVKHNIKLTWTDHGETPPDNEIIYTDKSEFASISLEPVETISVYTDPNSDKSYLATTHGDGFRNEAFANNTVALGNNLRIQGNDKLIVGKYNSPEADSVFEFGGGTGVNELSYNLLSILQNGALTFKNSSFRYSYNQSGSTLPIDRQLGFINNIFIEYGDSHKTNPFTLQLGEFNTTKNNLIFILNINGTYYFNEDHECKLKFPTYVPILYNGQNLGTNVNIPMTFNSDIYSHMFLCIYCPEYILQSDKDGTTYDNKALLIYSL